MNYIEAIKAAIEGKEIRRKKWAEGKYFQFQKWPIMSDDLNVVCATHSVESILAEDWEIVKKTYPLLEAIKRGTLIKRKDWFGHIEVRGGAFFNQENRLFPLTIVDITATDWVIVETNEKK